jgi:hypothetical protein
MTFPRNDPHEVLVQQIQEALTALGWCVEPMGQEQFSATMQENLHNCALPDGRPLPFRWLPDLLATRPPHAYFIDAKSSETWRQTGNHALEQNALAALNWTAIWEMDVWYEALGEMARSAAGQRVGHAVLVIPRWSHDALGTTALHKPTLKTKALPLSRPRHPTPC